MSEGTLVAALAGAVTKNAGRWADGVGVFNASPKIRFGQPALSGVGRPGIMQESV